MPFPSFFPDGPVAPMWWWSWFAKIYDSVIHRCFWRKWSLLVLVMSSCVDWSIPYWTSHESARRWRTLANYFNAQLCSEALRKRPTLAPPICPWSTDDALSGACQNGNSVGIEYKSTPGVWYASLLANPRGRYQPFRANSKIIYKVGNWHSSNSLRRDMVAAGPHSYYSRVSWTLT